MITFERLVSQSSWERQSWERLPRRFKMFTSQRVRESFWNDNFSKVNASVKEKSDIKKVRRSLSKVCHTARNVRDILVILFFFSALKINILPEYFIFIWKLVHHILDSKFMISWSHCLMKILNSMCILILNLTYIHVRVCTLSPFGHVWLFETLRTVALQAPLFTGFSRQE